MQFHCLLRGVTITFYFRLVTDIIIIHTVESYIGKSPETTFDFHSQPSRKMGPASTDYRSLLIQ